jgi:hypothetical protein
MELTDIWPPLPVIIRIADHQSRPEDYNFDAAIVHHNRVCEIDLQLTGSQLQRLASVMQKQFPALIDLKISCYACSGKAPALPDGF